MKKTITEAQLNAMVFNAVKRILSEGDVAGFDNPAIDVDSMEEPMSSVNVDKVTASLIKLFNKCMPEKAGTYDNAIRTCVERTANKHTELTTDNDVKTYILTQPHLFSKWTQYKYVFNPGTRKLVLANGKSSAANPNVKQDALDIRKDRRMNSINGNG